MCTTFQKRHYEIIAKAARTSEGDWIGLMAELTAIFKADNPRFDEERFRKACCDWKAK